MVQSKRSKLAWFAVIALGLLAAAVWMRRFAAGGGHGSPETQAPTTSHGNVSARSAGDGALPAGAGASPAASIREPTSPLPPSSNPAAPQAQAPNAAEEGAIAPSAARFADASVPPEKRMAEIEQLGKSGDADAAHTLMELGDAHTYLNFKAIEALGNMKTPEAVQYLEGKTSDKDPKIVAAALQSLARAQGAESIPAIAAAIAANRQRPDGFQDTVCAAGVRALGEIGSPKAIPALEAELQNTVGKTLQQEYGSQVVAAFKAIGDPTGVPALEAYSRRLQTQRDGMDNNPLGQRYLEGKIKEAREAIASMTRKSE